MLQTAGEVAQVGRVVLLPGLPQDLPDAGMEALVQPVRDVAPLVHLVEGRRPPEGPPDRLSERCRGGIETALDLAPRHWPR